LLDGLEVQAEPFGDEGLRSAFNEVKTGNFFFPIGQTQ
jgi:hypothetical protein